MGRAAAAELEFHRVLAMVAAHARSAAGRRLFEVHDALPTVGEGVLASRLTAEMERVLAEEGPLSFAGIDEAEPWLTPEAPSPRAVEDLMALTSCARRVAAVRKTLLALPGELAILHDLAGRLPDVAGLVEWAAARLGRDGRVPDGASPKLASLRASLVRLRSEVLRELEALRRSHAEACADAPPTVRRDRYCLPVRRTHRGEVPGLVLDSSGSGATLYVEPYSAVELNNRIAETTAAERHEVQRILDEVAAAFAAARAELAGAVEVLARLDAAQARALFGRAVEGLVVVPGESEELVLRGARHPLLDGRLHPLRRELFGEAEGSRREVVPLDLSFPEGVRTLVISGPNAGGKTVALKTVGLMVLMAYHGIPLPAAPGTGVPALDRLWCHIGDEQNVAEDLSTFSGAMDFSARMLREAGEGSLVLYDELGAGTDPLEGAALGFALLEELTRRGALTLATTHLAAIAMNAASAAGMENAAMEFDEGAGRPTYTLRLGRAGRSRGLEIAEAMGVPPAVLGRARELLGGEHLELERWLKRLETLEAELRSEREEIRRRLEEAARQERRAAEERRRLESERKGLRDRLAAERERLRRTAREKLDAVLAEIESARREREHLGRRRQEQLRSRALDLPVPGEGGRTGGAGGDAGPGDTVRIGGLGATGRLEEVRGSRARVAVGGKHLWVPLAELQRVEGVPGKPAGGEAIRVHVEETVPEELDLRGMDAEAAREELEHWLDRALAAGVSSVRVIHGHGTGTLRRMVREICRTHPAVRSFRHPPGHRGGTGATEIELAGPADG